MKEAQHKPVHEQCDKLIIGDSKSKHLYPSAKEDLCVRTYPNIALERLTDIIKNFSVNTNITDVSLIAGCYEVTPQMCFSSFRYQYNVLLDTVEKTFPKAHVSLFSMLSIVSNPQMRQSIMTTNDTLQDLAYARKYTKYIDPIACLTHREGYQSEHLFGQSGMYINTKGDHFIRKQILSTINRWRSSQTENY